MSHSISISLAPLTCLQGTEWQEWFYALPSQVEGEESEVWSWHSMKWSEDRQAGKALLMSRDNEHLSHVKTMANQDNWHIDQNGNRRLSVSCTPSQAKEPHTYRVFLHLQHWGRRWGDWDESCRCWGWPLAITQGSLWEDMRRISFWYQFLSFWVTFLIL